MFEPSQLKEKLLTEKKTTRSASKTSLSVSSSTASRSRTCRSQQSSSRKRPAGSRISFGPRSSCPHELHVHFTKAVGKVLEFFVVDGVEVPYVFQHRKDYLIYTKENTESRAGSGRPRSGSFTPRSSLRRTICGGS